MPRSARRAIRRRIAYVTGTRAEFGLMQSTLAAIRAHSSLELQLVVTGMHLSKAHGRTIGGIRKAGWAVDATVPWPRQGANTHSGVVGRAMSGFAGVFAKLNPDIVLVCGDRVEPFAAASAAHLDGRIVAHVHGGDRAQGQVDDTLRHVLTKLAHIHFPATAESAQRIFSLGEDKFRIHRTGTPGLDGIAAFKTRGPRSGAVIVLHPDTTDAAEQRSRAQMLVPALKAAGIEQGVVIAPNNDPGWQGIAAAWADLRDLNWIVHADLPREAFLQHLARAALLIGNSSSGIIEAASLGTWVINIGDRQKGRERSANVIDVPWKPAAIIRAIRRVKAPFTGRNVYGGGDAGRKIADVLATVPIDDRLRAKLIRY